MLSFLYSPTLISIESVMPSNHLVLCCPLLLLPSIFLSIRVFSNELAPWNNPHLSLVQRQHTKSWFWKSTTPSSTTNWEKNCFFNRLVWLHQAHLSNLFFSNSTLWCDHKVEVESVPFSPMDYTGCVHHGWEVLRCTLEFYLSREWNEVAKPRVASSFESLVNSHLGTTCQHFRKKA